MNDCISWVIDGHMEKECVIEQSLVCALVTLMAIGNKHRTDRRDGDQYQGLGFQNRKLWHVTRVHGE